MRRVRVATLLATVGLASTLVAACHGTENQSDGAAAATPPVATTASGQPPESWTDAAEPLPQSNYTLRFRLTNHGDQTTGGPVYGTGLDALGPDGSAVIDRSVTDSKGLVLLSSHELLRQPDGQEIAIPWTPEMKGGGPGPMTVSRHWVVWVEGNSNNLEQDPWIMHAYNRTTGKVTDLAAHTKLDDGSLPPNVPGFTGLVISDDARVYWIQADGTRRRPRADLLGCDIASCHPRIIRKNTAYVSGDGGTVRALTLGRNGHLVDAQNRVNVVEVQGSTAPVVGSIAVAAGDHVSGYAHGRLGDLVTVDRDDSTRAIGTRPDGTIRWVVHGRSGESFSYPLVSDHAFAWAEGSGTSGTNVGGYLVLGNESTVRSIGNASGYYAINLSGRYLSWVWLEHRRAKRNRVVHQQVVALRN